MIVVHKPTALLDDVATDKVLDAFKEYCGNRGFLMDPLEPTIKRRKRTIVYTAKNEKAASVADNIFEANNGKLIPLKALAGLSKAEKLKMLDGTFSEGMSNAGAQSLDDSKVTRPAADDKKMYENRHAAANHLAEVGGNDRDELPLDGSMNGSMRGTSMDGISLDGGSPRPVERSGSFTTPTRGKALARKAASRSNSALRGRAEVKESVVDI